MATKKTYVAKAQPVAVAAVQQSIPESMRRTEPNRQFDIAVADILDARLNHGFTGLYEVRTVKGPWAELASQIVVKRDHSMDGKIAEFIQGRDNDTRWLRFFEVVDADDDSQVLGVICVFMRNGLPHEVHWVSL